MVKAKSLNHYYQRNTNIKLSSEQKQVGSVVSSAVQSDSASIGREMLHRTDFLFPWLKNVIAYRKKRGYVK